MAGKGWGGGAGARQAGAEPGVVIGTRINGSNNGGCLWQGFFVRKKARSTQSTEHNRNGWVERTCFTDVNYVNGILM